MTLCIRKKQGQQGRVTDLTWTNDTWTWQTSHVAAFSTILTPVSCLILPPSSWQNLIKRDPKMCLFLEHWIGRSKRVGEKAGTDRVDWVGYEWSDFAFCPRNPPHVRVMSSKPGIPYTTLLLNVAQHCEYIMIVSIIQMNCASVFNNSALRWIAPHEITLWTVLCKNIY